MHTIKLLLTYYLNISIQAANLSDCRIESKKNRFGSENRIESNRNFFCPNWNALLSTRLALFCCRPTVDCYKEIQVLTKIRVLPSETLSQSPDLENVASAYRPTGIVYHTLFKLMFKLCLQYDTVARVD